MAGKDLIGTGVSSSRITRLWVITVDQHVCLFSYETYLLLPYAS